MNRLIDKNRYGSAQSTLDSPGGVPKILAAFVFLAAVLGLASPATAATEFQKANDGKITLISESGVVPNQAIDPGETNKYSFSFKLTGGDLNNVKVSLVADANVTFPSPGEIALGNITKDSTKNVEFTFVSFGACGSTLSPKLHFTADGGYSQDVTWGPFLIGKVTYFNNTFGPSGAVTIKDASKADPYPSKINVKDMSFDSNNLLDNQVEKVVVTLTGLTHGFSPDVDVLLVGPQGQKVVLMSDAGAFSTPDGVLNNVTLTFDKDASSTIPFGTPISSGSYKPADYDQSNTEFPDNNGPFGSITDFRNTNPNGDWKLFIVDDNVIDAGTLASWSLNIVTRKVVCSGGGFPTIESIGKVETLEDPNPTNPPKTAEFKINDAEESGDLSKLTVTITSDRPDMFPKGMNKVGDDTAADRVGSFRVFNGTASDQRVIYLYPAKDVTGIANITVTVTDPQNHASAVSFEFKVNPDNDPPAIADIPNYASNVGTPTAQIPFTVSDVDNNVDSLSVQVYSTSAPAVAPLTGIIITGSGANRYIQVYPASSTTTGQSTITLKVLDPVGGESLKSFAVAFDVTAGYPTVAPIADQVTDEDTAKSVTFGVSDASTSPDSLIVTATSDNQTILPNANLVVSGSGTIRTLKMTPAANNYGIAQVTVTVKSPVTSKETVRKFNLTINAVNDKPYFVFGSTSITINEDTASAEIPFGVFDNEQNAGPDLVLNNFTGANSGPGVPSFTTAGLIQSVVFTGSGNADLTSRKLKITPVPNAFGKTKMTLRTTDAAGAEGTIDLEVIVNGVNDKPTLDVPGANVSINEDVNGDDNAAGRYTLTGITPGPANEVYQALTVTATSGNTAVLPNPSVSLDQANGTATLKFKPVANAVANDIVITVTVKDNGGTANGGEDTVVKTFKVNVNQVNDDPTLADIAAQTAYKNQNKTVIVSIGDVETAATDLTVTAQKTADPDNLIKSLVVTSGGSLRSITLESTGVGNFTQNAAAPAVVKVTVTDPNGGKVEKSFNFTVANAVMNAQPQIVSLKVNGADLPDPLPMDEDSIKDVTVNVSDDADVAKLKMSATSDNPALLPASNLLPSGNGAARVLTLVPLPNKSGEAVVTVTVVDQDEVNPLAVSKSFKVKVNDIPDFPTIVAKDNKLDYSVTEDKTLEFEITVGDAETTLDKLTFEVDSSNTDLLPKSGIVVPINGNATRTVKLTPAKDKNSDKDGGVVKATIRVVDESGLKNVLEVNLTVNADNDPPTINKNSDITINEDASETVVNMSGITGGPSNEDQTITFENGNKAYSDKTSVIAELNTSITDFSAADKTAKLRFTPSPNANGTVKLSVVVVDSNGAKATNSFNVIVKEVNDAPTITAIPNPAAVDEGKTITTAAFNVSDIETPPQNLVTEFVSSSNPNLVDASGVAFSGGVAASRGMVITPKPGANGTAVVTIQVKDTGNSDGSDVKATQTSFTVTVNSVDDKPTVSAIADVTTLVNQESPIISFTVNDPETPANELTVTATATSNPGLVKSIQFDPSATGATRRIIIIPATDAAGEATITVAATDKGTPANTGATTFKFKVVRPNNPPVITGTFPNKTINMNESVVVNFSVSDPETASGFLTVTGKSSAQSVIPDANVIPSGLGTSRTVTVLPLQNKSGSALITIRASDPDGNYSEVNFTVTVLGTGEPTISTIADQTTPEDTAIVVPFTVGDNESPVGSLLVTATSGDTKVVPTANIVISASGANRTATITPAKDATGENILITLTVADPDGKSAVSSFKLTVTPVEDNPTIGSIPNQNTTVGQSVGPLGFTVSDAETAAEQLVVTATSDNNTLVPAAGLTLGGTGSARTLTIAPAAGVSGTANITLTVRDGANKTATTSFVLSVVPGVAKNNSINADKKADLLFQATDGTLATWLMDDADYVIAQVLDPSAAAPGWKLVATGDLDKDGKMDLFFQHADGTLAVWYMNGISMKSAELLTPNNSGADWKVVAASDVNNDGKLDLVFQATDGTIAAWLMNGSTMVSAQLATPAAPGDANWRIVGMADMNKDGKGDLVFQNNVTGELAAWFMNGLTLQEGAYLNPANPGAGWKAKVVADYSGDGKADLIFQNGADTAIWFMDGINLISGDYLPNTGSADWSIVGPK